MRHILAALILLSTVACDESLETCQGQDAVAPDIDREAPLMLAGPPASDDLRFREQGPPSAWVITSWSGNVIKTAEFAKAVVSCVAAGDPQWTCTLSWYSPDTTQPNFVGGLGCSAWFTPSLQKCLISKWQENGAVKIQ